MLPYSGQPSVTLRTEGAEGYVPARAGRLRAQARRTSGESAPGCPQGTTPPTKSLSGRPVGARSARVESSGDVP